MEFDVNYLSILASAVVAMIIGSIWYGPLFGKKWMLIIGIDTDKLSKSEIKKMQKEAAPYYALQFLLSLVTGYVLYHNVQAWPDGNGLYVAFSLWLGFVMPVQAGEVLWGGIKSSSLRLQKFLISTSYQLVYMLVIGYIFFNY